MKDIIVTAPPNDTGDKPEPNANEDAIIEARAAQGDIWREQAIDIWREQAINAYADHDDVQLRQMLVERDLALESLACQRRDLQQRLRRAHKRLADYASQLQATSMEIADFTSRINFRTGIFPLRCNLTPSHQFTRRVRYSYVEIGGDLGASWDFEKRGAWGVSVILDISVVCGAS